MSDHDLRVRDGADGVALVTVTDLAGDTAADAVRAALADADDLAVDDTHGPDTIRGP